jgi:hypothetical protein
MYEGVSEPRSSAAPHAFDLFTSEQEATNLAEVVEKILDPAPAKRSELIDRPRILPPGRSPVRIQIRSCS